MVGAKADVRKILLVDDDELVRDLVAATIRDSKYTLLHADDGKSALHMAREEAPDLVFLDVNMPVMDGVAVCKALKSDPRTRNIAVIMLTALGHDEDRKRAERAGANGYFIKPFSPLRLLRKIDEVLAERNVSTMSR